jgi:hypothetical protein
MCRLLIRNALTRRALNSNRLEGIGTDHAPGL